MIRVLHVVSAVNLHGVMSFIMNYYSHIDRKQIQFDFLTLENDDDGGVVRTIEQMGGKVYNIPILQLSKILQNHWKMFLFFKAHAREFDILHVHNLGGALVTLFFAFLFGIRVRILHSHSTIYSTTPLKSLRNFIYTKIFKPFSTDYWACSIFAGEFLYGAKCFKKRGVYIHNAIEYSRFLYSPERRAQVRKSLNISPETLVVLHVGGLSLIKNPLFLVEVFAEIHKRVPDSVLLAAGKPFMKKEVLASAEKYGCVDSIKLLGLRSDVHDLYSCADVLIFPSFMEGLPVTVVEAQFASLPLLLSDTITPQVKFLPTVEFLSLKKHSPAVWAEVALKSVKMERRVLSDEVIENSGFDIFREVHNLEQHYTAFTNKN